MIDIFLELRYTLCDAFQLIHRIKIARNDERVLPSSSFSENPNAFEKGGGSEEEGRGLENKILDFISRPLLLQREREPQEVSSLLRPSSGRWHSAPTKKQTRPTAINLI